MRVKVLLIALLTTVCSTLVGCGQSEEEKLKQYINGDTKGLTGLSEKYQLAKQESNNQGTNGIDVNYKKLSGNIDILTIYTLKETDKMVLYNAKFNEGNFRLILVKPDGEVADIINRNGEAYQVIKVPAGKSIIKLIGSNATGNLKVNVAS